MANDPDVRLLDVRPRGDITSLPLELDISPSKTQALSRILLGAVFIVVAGAIHFGEDSFGLGAVGNSFLILAIAAGTFVVAALQMARGLVSLSSGRHLTISDGVVRVRSKSLFRSEDWSEPLSGYQGVRWREIVVHPKGSSGTSDRRRSKYYQYIDLAHEDRAKSLPLHVTLVKDSARGTWEGLARLIGVPAIDIRGGEAHVRAAEDVDKSLGQLAAEGKISAEWSDEDAPDGVSVAYEGADQITVTIHARRYSIWAYAAAAAFGLVFLLIGIFDFSIVMLLIGAAGLYGVRTYHRLDGEKHRQVVVTRDNVQLLDPKPWSDPINNVIPLARIESARVNTRVQLAPGELRLDTDDGEYSTGTGLSAEGLEWLRKLVVAAVATA